MIIGFCLASYAIVANDSIQTLGTFLSSNSEKKWWWLWMYAGGILSFVLLYGWYVNNGDPAYGRLTMVPTVEFSWVHILPPLALLVLTRFGYPVSTTFLVLTIFVQSNVDKMVWKSLNGYLLAFGIGFVAYFLTRKFYDRFFLNKQKSPPGRAWFIAQWVSTGFLWSQWLMQDLANIYVYMPRRIGLQELLISLGAMLLLQAVIFYRRGGAIQKVVTSKTNTHDIRSATIIDLIFGFILYYFKTLNNIPMSTTWVFLGLLGGRELAISLLVSIRNSRYAWMMIFKDLGKATVGMVVSVAIALFLGYTNSKQITAKKAAAVPKAVAAPAVNALPVSPKVKKVAATACNADDCSKAAKN